MGWKCRWVAVNALSRVAGDGKSLGGVDGVSERKRTELQNTP